MPQRIIRVLVAKPGLDGHDRGAKIIARSLRDAGMEVIYTGIRQTPEMIVEAALEEDVDVIGLSILSGAHMDLFPLVFRGLEENGMQNVVVVAGGIIPEVDRSALEEMGVKAVFGPGNVHLGDSRLHPQRDRRARRRISLGATRSPTPLIEAVIFDFDGVIIDTETPDYSSWQEVFNAHGVDLDRSLWARFIGGRVETFDVYQHLEDLIGGRLDRDAVRQERRRRYLSCVESSPVLPGVLDYIQEARELGLKLGVASSSNRAWVEGHLNPNPPKDGV